MVTAKKKVCIGSSAGSYVLTPSIVSATWNSKHNFNRHQITDFSALNLFPCVIKCHANESEKKSLEKEIKKLPLSG